MKKFVLLLLVAIMLVMPMTAMAAEELVGNPSGRFVKVDDKDITMDAFLVKGSNYVKLTDIASLLKDTKAKFTVDTDAEKKTIVITKGEAASDEFVAPEELNRESYPATPSEMKVSLADGTALELEGYTINDEEYFKIRDIGKALEFGVAYDFTKNTVLIDSENLDIKDYSVVEKYEAPINKIETEKGTQDIRFLIYGFEECPFCVKLKAYLDEKGIEYNMVNIRNNDAKKAEVYKEFYTKFDKEYDRVYFPTHIMTLEEDGKSIDRAEVGFSEEKYDEIFEQIKNNTYFGE